MVYTPASEDCAESAVIVPLMPVAPVGPVGPVGPWSPVLPVFQTDKQASSGLH